VQQLERGTWLAFTQRDDSIKKVKLAWISPLRSLFIFSTRDRLESFSLSAEELAKNLREDRAKIVLLGGLVGRALAEALDSAGVNEPAITVQSAAFA
jgi:2-keto-3-deoxy-galactonokinase